MNGLVSSWQSTLVQFYNATNENKWEWGKKKRVEVLFDMHECNNIMGECVLQLICIRDHVYLWTIQMNILLILYTYS